MLVFFEKYFIFIAVFIRSLTQGLYLFLLAYCLGVQQFGAFTVAMVVVGVFCTISSSGIALITLEKTAIEKKLLLNISAAIYRNYRAGLFIFPAYILVVQHEFIKMDLNQLCLLYFSEVLMIPIFDIISRGLQAGGGKIWGWSILIVPAYRLSSVLIVLIIIDFQLENFTFNLWFFLYAIPLVIFSIIITILIFYKENPRGITLTSDHAWKYTLSGLIQKLTAESDKILIEIFYGSYLVGVYTLVQRLAEMAVLPTVAFTESISGKLYKKNDKKYVPLGEFIDVSRVTAFLGLAGFCLYFIGVWFVELVYRDIDFPSYAFTYVFCLFPLSLSVWFGIRLLLLTAGNHNFVIKLELISVLIVIVGNLSLLQLIGPVVSSSLIIFAHVFMISICIFRVKKIT